MLDRFKGTPTPAPKAIRRARKNRDWGKLLRGAMNSPYAKSRRDARNRPR